MFLKFVISGLVHAPDLTTILDKVEILSVGNA